MQQCSQCTELIPRGVLMVQHITAKHLVRCSVVLRHAKDKDRKIRKKSGMRQLSHTAKKLSGTSSSGKPACSVALSRLSER